MIKRVLEASKKHAENIAALHETGDRPTARE
jgi:hypothetical protein